MKRQDLPDHFIQHFSELLNPKSHILDLGARDGGTDKVLLEYRPALRFTAVDIMTDEQLAKEKIRPERYYHPQITWIISDVVDYVQKLADEDTFDAILTRNIFQFLPKDVVLKNLIPRLQQQLNSGGLFAIRTFFQEPEPTFKQPFVSLFTSDDLITLFPIAEWYHHEVIMNDAEMPSLAGDRRLFHLTTLLLQKK